MLRINLEFLLYLLKLNENFKEISSILLVILSAVFVLLCIAACCIYLAYMQQDQESGSSLLNILHGHLAVVIPVS